MERGGFGMALLPRVAWRKRSEARLHIIDRGLYTSIDRIWRAKTMACARLSCQIATTSSGGKPLKPTEA